MKHLSRTGIVAAALFVLAACANTVFKPSAEGLIAEAEQTVIILKGRADLAQFRAMLKDAAGVAIFPTVYKAGFFIGAEAGNGLLMARDAAGNWSNPAFYTLGSGSFGFQFGGQQAQIVFIIRSRRAVRAIIKNQGKLGADAGLTVGIFGAGIEGSTTTNLGFDVVAFTDAIGLFAGVSLEGSAMIRREDLNTQAYGAGATPAAIVLENKFKDSRADRLKAALVVR